MLNMHDKLVEFHNQCIQLPQNKKQVLVEYGNANLANLRLGLEKLSRKGICKPEVPIRSCTQGSYAMDTMIQSSQDNYDIDIGLVFPREDIPNSAVDARRLVMNALEIGSKDEGQKIELGKNAVTIWYPNGIHIDLPVYREYENKGQPVIEHASSDWEMNYGPKIAEAFNEKVRELSPRDEQYISVAPYQMRRIVRFLKAFAKLYDEAFFPCSIEISALVTVCYRMHCTRDDIALYETMVAVLRQLESSLTIPNPFDESQRLTYKSEEEKRERANRFKEEMKKAVDSLKILFDDQITYGDGARAWHTLFQHPYWIKK